VQTPTVEFEPINFFGKRPEGVELMADETLADRTF
jgi:hypothetical protein